MYLTPASAALQYASSNTPKAAQINSNEKVNGTQL